MNKRKQELLTAIKALADEQKTLFAKGDEMTDEELTRIGEIDTDLDLKQTELDRVNAALDAQKKSVVRDAWLNNPAGDPLPVPEPTGKGERVEIKSYSGKITAFQGTPAERQQKAHDFGMWAFAALAKNDRALAYCEKAGIETKAQREDTNTLGGYLVPPQFDGDIISIIERYGVIRQYARYTRMASDVVNRPRRTGGVTAYHVGEASIITESNKNWDSVNLTAKKIATLSKFTSEVSEDAVIDLGNDLAEEAGIAFALKEDQDGFLGDGTSTYGGILGLVEALKKTVTDAGGTWTTDSHKVYNPSIVVAAGNAFSEITLGNFTTLMGSVHSAVRGNELRWYCNRSFYYSVMLNLMLAAGGNTLAMIADPRTGEPMFLGHPVSFVQVLIDQEANSGVPCLFGDLALGAMFGDRRQRTIALSEHLDFDTDQINIRCTERFDIKIHDVGTANSSAASRVKSPIGALALANA